MEDEINPGWINVLYKSRMELFNKYYTGFCVLEGRPIRLVTRCLRYFVA